MDATDLLFYQAWPRRHALIPQLPVSAYLLQREDMYIFISYSAEL